MKNMKLLVALSMVAVSLSCTKLDEELRDSLESKDESVNASGLLQSAYESMNNPFQDQSRFWAAQEHTTDEALGPTRGPDWDDNGVWRVLHAHTWNADHGFLRDTYRELLQIQFSASSVLEKSPTPQQAAEAKFIRALSMFAVLDGWDQVPYRANLTDLTQLPETKKGVECADFIISELEGSIASLPDGPAIKANKNAARALLMKLYLNRAVYANRAAPNFAAAGADMDKVISLANQITGYTLDDNFFENFAPDNSSKSSELIYALENTGATRGGNVRSRWYCTLHYNQNPSGWNGFATLADFYDKFETADKRRNASYPGVTDLYGLKVGLLEGQQFDKNGNKLKDRNGNDLAFTRQVALKETGANLEVTGIRVVKYPPDYTTAGDQKENEYVIFRWADVVLMKAEAHLRKGDAASALPLVNSIRQKRGVADLTSIDLPKLLEERGREMYWEGWRRNDLIRFGKFLDPLPAGAGTTSTRPTKSNVERLLFAIPNEQLSVNPNLVQNPGYK